MPPDPKGEKRVRDPDLMRELHLEYLGEPCDHCERRPGIQLHHVIFRSQGGSDVRENLSWLCHSCHQQAHGLG